MSEEPAGVFAEPAIQQAKKEIFDPRTISLDHDKEGRTATLELAMATKTNIQDTQANVAERGQKIQEIAELTSASVEEEKQKTLELTLRMETLLVKIKSLLGVDDKEVASLQTEIDTLRLDRDILRDESSLIKIELNALKEKQSNIPRPKELLDAYYEKMLSTPLSNEQKRELLKPEILKELSMEEYVALWKRLNPYFLSHVTRQGFRDHNAMFYHSAGMQEFHNGFIGIENDEMQIRPSLARGGLKNRDEASVKMYLDNDALQADNVTEAKNRFDTQLHWSIASAPAYPDNTSVHFASQIVANSYYGGESDNEIFFIFPSDTIASQYDFGFNSGQKDFINLNNTDEKWNNLFVWPKTVNDPGISVDSGIVFLPEKTLVDPNNGSKYASEVRIVDGKEQAVMIENTEAITNFLTWAGNFNEESDLIKLGREYLSENGNFQRDEIESRFKDLGRQELTKMGFDQDAIQVFLPVFFQRCIFWNTDGSMEIAQELIANSRAKYLKARNPIQAKEYWEGYFSKHPDQKPKHIIYYNGDPTNAVYRFQQENGIGAADTSKIDGPLLGFDDHFVNNMETDPRANQGHDELVKMGNKIIEEHYASR
jgi:hypothetical protein